MSLQIKDDNYPRSITYLGDHETKWTINNIVADVMRRYKSSSLTELNAVLRRYTLAQKAIAIENVIPGT